MADPFGWMEQDYLPQIGVFTLTILPHGDDFKGRGLHSVWRLHLLTNLKRRHIMVKLVPYQYAIGLVRRSIEIH